ncbi:Protein Wiz [Chelonia mydas]|uniref:Protein Wiz n=1 Tax=Chelonia mydas TaxID=8469 RepID=M7B2M5_CHEMY|nr:Protein Wiz [Chelonia mydas]
MTHPPPLCFGVLVKDSVVEKKLRGFACAALVSLVAEHKGRTAHVRAEGILLPKFSEQQHRDASGTHLEEPLLLHKVPREFHCGSPLVFTRYNLAVLALMSHFTRAQASSAAFMVQVPIQDICRAAMWTDTSLHVLKDSRATLQSLGIYTPGQKRKFSPQLQHKSPTPHSLTQRYYEPQREKSIFPNINHQALNLPLRNHLPQNIGFDILVGALTDHSLQHQLQLTNPSHPFRFCEVEFQGPLSIQEEWVRHLQRHILEMNFSKADPLRSEPEAPEVQAVAEAQ